MFESEEIILTIITFSVETDLILNERTHTEFRFKKKTNAIILRIKITQQPSRKRKTFGQLINKGKVSFKYRTLLENRHYLKRLSPTTK